MSREHAIPPSSCCDGTGAVGICLVIVAGPQGSGKSTAQRHLVYRYCNVVLLREAAQILFDTDRKRGVTLGGALVGSDFERRILELDLERMRRISFQGRREAIYLDETNIFSVAHESLKDPSFAQEMHQRYLQALRNFRVGVLFTNVSPEISWMRRRRVYERRYRGAGDLEEKMRRSKEYLWKVYPEMIKLYWRLPFVKRLVETEGPRVGLGRKVEDAFEQICQELSFIPIQRGTAKAR